MYTADFETTTDVNDCRVWLWAICEIGYPDNVYYGNDIDSFFNLCKESGNLILYFHNLKFDGSFILNWLFNNGFLFVDGRKIPNRCFTTLISDKGLFYKIKIRFDNGNSLELRDSLKLLTFSVDQIAKAFNLPYQKLEIDYSKLRPIGYEPTEKEKEYIHSDVAIMSLALHQIFGMGYKKLTQGSCALEDFIKIIGGKKKFRHIFPLLPYDSEIRKSYKGGFTYLNPIYADKDIGIGIVLDVNSLYPSCMYFSNLPYGEGKYFDGKYIYDNKYQLYIINFRCEFELKEGKIPTIQLKKNYRFMPTEYVTSSDGDVVEMCLTSVDFELFLEHYHVYNLEFFGGWKFKQNNTIFRSYIDKWMKIKIESSINGNKTLRTWAKIMLNSLYGKFALNPICAKKVPYMGEDGILHFTVTNKEEREGNYLPVGAFITAYARRYTIESSQKIKDYSIRKYGVDMYIYSDTDSIHTTLPKEEVKNILEIDDNELGKWKIENEFERARFLRAKSYIEDINGMLQITCAGLPERCYNQVTWENFHPDVVYSGKLVPRQEKGGIVLHETEFHIRAT